MFHACIKIIFVSFSHDMIQPPFQLALPGRLFLSKVHHTRGKPILNCIHRLCYDVSQPEFMNTTNYKQISMSIFCPVFCTESASSSLFILFLSVLRHTCEYIFLLSQNTVFFLFFHDYGFDTADTVNV